MKFAAGTAFNCEASEKWLFVFYVVFKVLIANLFGALFLRGRR